MAPLSTADDDKSHRVNHSHHSHHQDCQHGTSNYESDLSTCYSDDLSLLSTPTPPQTHFVPSPKTQIQNIGGSIISTTNTSNTISNTSGNTIAIGSDSPPLLPSSTFSSTNSTNTNTNTNTQTKLIDSQSACNLKLAYPKSHDFLPRLTLTMSDSPSNSIRTIDNDDDNNVSIQHVDNHAAMAADTTAIMQQQQSHSHTNNFPLQQQHHHQHRRRQINLSLSIPLIPSTPKSPIPAAKTLLSLKSKQAKIAFQQQNQKLQQRIRTFRQRRILRRELRLTQRKKQQLLQLEKRKQRQLTRQQQRQQRRNNFVVLIPSNHSLKLLWDALTILITFISAFQLHAYIRDRSTYDYDAFSVFSNIWFGIDLLLNFITDHRTSDGTVLRTGREVAGRYLTTWFAVDALSLLPWERMFIRPIILMQNRRNIVTKWFFRSKGVVKVTRYLGKRKFLIKYFKNVSKETKKIGVGANRLIRLLIKYIPKYLLFYRNMKGVLFLKTLRQVHYLKKLSRGLTSKFHNDDEGEDEGGIHDEHDELLHDDDEDDDDDVASVESVDLDYVTGVNSHEERIQNLDLKFNFSLDDNRLSSLHNRHKKIDMSDIQLLKATKFEWEIPRRRSHSTQCLDI